MFSLVGCLPSMPFASGCPLLFGHFVGSTQPSDSPSACMLDFRLMAFSNRPATSTGTDWASRFSRVEFPCMPGVSDCAESTECSRWRPLRYCLPSCVTASALCSRLFRSSIPCLHVPLSTLQWQPRGWPRMTRGQDGSLTKRGTTVGCDAAPQKDEVNLQVALSCSHELRGRPMVSRDVDSAQDINFCRSSGSRMESAR